MMATMDLTAWSATIGGFYLLASGIGALRNPNAWRMMIEEVGKSPALQLVAGLLEILVGAIIYLANPWDPADLLSCLLKAGGGLMILEALMISAFGDIYTQFWLRTLNHMHRGWSLLMIVVGVGMALLGMFRFG